MGETVTRSKRWTNAVAVSASTVLLAGCGLIGGGSGPAGTTKATVGDLTVHYPDGWTVLQGGDKPAGWDWAAQDRAGQSGTAQLAVDGDHSAQSVDISVAQLLASAQVGSYPRFALQAQRPVEVKGADKAMRIEGIRLVSKTKTAIR